MPVIPKTSNPSNQKTVNFPQTTVNPLTTSCDHFITGVSGLDSESQVETAQQELRRYQQLTVNEILSLYDKGVKRVLAQLATGAGKTRLAAYIVRLFALSGYQVLWLAHSEELVLQAAEQLQQSSGLPVGIIKAGYKPDYSAPIQVASVQSLVRRADIPINPALVVTDEAHHAVANTYRAIYDRFPVAFHLGLTATPKRLDGKGLSDSFDVLVSGPSVKELIDDGYLSNYRLYAAASQIDTTGIKTTAGDYNIAQLARAATSADVMGAIVPAYLEYAKGKQTVAFSSDRESSRQYCQVYRAAGIAAEHLDGTTPMSERREILKRFASGEITVLTNCGIISEGLDIPGIEAIQCLRPTKSISLYLQQIGRALRPAPGKSAAILIDHTANWLKHGLPDDDREWSLDGSVKRQQRTLERRPSGEVVEVQKRVITFDPTVRLAEVKRGYANQGLLDRLDLLIHQQRQRGYKPGWVAFKFLELNPSLEDLNVCAKRLGYSFGWAWHQFQQLQNGAEVGGVY